MSEMKSEKTVAKSAFGKALKKAIPYEFSWEVYTTDAELVAAGDQMSIKEQRQARNAQSKAKARGEALTIALKNAGIEKPNSANDEQVRLMDVYNGLVNAKTKTGEPKYTKEKAREMAVDLTGVDWPDDEDEPDDE